MFDGFPDDDDSFFTPVSNSNLASLFGTTMTQANPPTVNTSLKYTAPKQPSSKVEDVAKNSTKNKHQSSLLIFKEVHAFKLIEKNYVNQGKCGLALIGNDTVQVYQLLLYKQKNDIISTSKISNSFQLIVQKDNYASYCDDLKQNWTIHYISESDLIEFSQVLESRGGKLIKNNENTAIDEDFSNPKSNLNPEKESPKHLDTDNQSDTSSNTAKANILSRMAKMGQKLLPNTHISDGTDSDTEKDKSSLMKSRKTKRISNTTAKSPEISNIVPSSFSNHTTTMSIPVCPQQLAIINGQYVPVPTNFASMPEEINPNFAKSETISSSFMCTPVIPQSQDLQIFFAENRTHNSEVRMNLLRLTNKVEEVLEKMQKTDAFPMKNSIDENRSDETLRNENENLKLIINKLEKTIETNTQLEHKVKAEYVEQNLNLKKETENLEKSVLLHEEKEDEYLGKIKCLEGKIKEYEENSVGYVEINDDKLIIDKKKYENIEEIIKKLMNSLYREVNECFKDDDNIPGKEVKKILAQKIIDSTYNIIGAVNELSLTKLNRNIE